jgi:hypothetical protein
MATFKICIFKHQKRRDDKYPVSIRVYWKRQYGYINTEYYVTEKQIIKKRFELKDPFILNELNSRIASYEELKAKKLGRKIELYTAKDLAGYFEKEGNPGFDSDLDFIAFSRKHCEKLISQGRQSTAAPMLRSINALVDYCHGRERILADEITAKFLKGFEAFLKGDRTLKRLNQFGNTVVTHKKGLSDVSILDYITDIRTLFNTALAEFNDYDKNEIRILHYPFKGYKLKKRPETRKRNLSVEDIRTIKDLPATGLSRADMARDVFMLSFYLAGTNLIDLYEADMSCYADNRFSYNRSKTKGRRQDSAFISVKVEPEAKPLFEKYRDPAGIRVFDFYNRYSTSHIFSSNMNKGLKVIAEKCNLDVPLSTYYARYSLATIARNKCDISKDDINLILNHVDNEMKVTDIYLEKDWTRIDRAIRKVLDLVADLDDIL